MELNKIYNEDCMDTLKRLEDNSIDATITSPPYNMNLRIRNGKYCSRQLVKEISTKYIDFNDNIPIDTYYQTHITILKELLRVSKLIFYNISIVTGSKRAFFKIIGELSDYIKDIIIWDKGYGQPSISEKVLNRRTELIIVLDNTNAISRRFDKATFNRGTLDDIWQINRQRSIDKNHLATFPEALVEHILTNFTNEKDIIYDPFLGTGTTAVVANRMNRHYIGSEIDTEYYKTAQDRLTSQVKKKFISYGKYF